MIGGANLNNGSNIIQNRGTQRLQKNIADGLRKPVNGGWIKATAVVCCATARQRQSWQTPFALSTMIVTYWMRLLSCQITFIYWSNHSALIDFQVFFIHGNLLPPRKLTKRRAVPATYGCPNLTIIS